MAKRKRKKEPTKEKLVKRPVGNPNMADLNRSESVGAFRKRYDKDGRKNPVTDDVKEGVGPSLLAVLDRQPEFKEIFFEYIHQYNNDPLFRGTMREAQHMALVDLILLLHVRRNLSTEDVEDTPQNNRMVL